MVAAREFVTATADLVAELSDEEKAVVPKSPTQASSGASASSGANASTSFL